MNMKQIAKSIEEITGINIVKIGRKHNREVMMVKWSFYRACFLKSIQCREMIKITGDKSFSTPSIARKKHISACKTNWELNQQWNKIKQCLKN